MKSRRCSLHISPPPLLTSASMHIFELLVILGKSGMLNNILVPYVSDSAVTIDKISCRLPYGIMIRITFHERQELVSTTTFSMSQYFVNNLFFTLNRRYWFRSRQNWLGYVLWLFYLRNCMDHMNNRMYLKVIG